MASPALEIQYSPLVEDTSAEQEPIFTMVPLFFQIQSCLSICLATNWVRNRAPFVLISITRSKLSSLISRMSLRSKGATAALFTSTSTLPKRPRAACGPRPSQCFPEHNARESPSQSAFQGRRHISPVPRWPAAPPDSHPAPAVLLWHIRFRGLRL